MKTKEKVRVCKDCGEWYGDDFFDKDPDLPDSIAEKERFSCCPNCGSHNLEVKEMDIEEI